MKSWTIATGILLLLWTFPKGPSGRAVVGAATTPRESSTARRRLGRGGSTGEIDTNDDLWDAWSDDFLQIEEDSDGPPWYYNSDEEASSGLYNDESLSSEEVYDKEEDRTERPSTTFRSSSEESRRGARRRSSSRQPPSSTSSKYSQRRTVPARRSSLGRTPAEMSLDMTDGLTTLSSEDANTSSKRSTSKQFDKAPALEQQSTVDTNTAASSDQSGMSLWVKRYLATKPTLLLVPRDFLLDNFNLAQLSPVVEAIVQSLPAARGIEFPSGWIYKQALQRIFSDENSSSTEVTSVVEDIIEMAASFLYQLVHQRYAQSPRGLEALRRRFLLWQYQCQETNSNDVRSSPPLPPYGRCPQPTCRGFCLVSSGPNVADTTADSRQWRYCGYCQNTWMVWGDAPEGCSWGASLGPLFHLTFPYFLQSATEDAHVCQVGEPRIFGFRLHPGATGSRRLSWDR